MEIQVHLLTVNLINFEMVLFLFGFFFVSWSFGILVLPLFFGFPYCVYWAIRGWVCWRGTLFYLVTPGLWMLALFVFASILTVAYPEVWRFLSGSEGLSLGIGAGAALSMARLVFSKSARIDTTRKVLGFLQGHLTPEGNVELKVLNWPDPSED